MWSISNSDNLIGRRNRQRPDRIQSEHGQETGADCGQLHLKPIFYDDRYDGVDKIKWRISTS